MGLLKEGEPTATPYFCTPASLPGRPGRKDETIRQLNLGEARLLGLAASPRMPGPASASPPATHRLASEAGSSEHVRVDPCLLAQALTAAAWC